MGLSLSLCVLVWQNYRERQEATAAAEKPKPDPRATAVKDSEEGGVSLEFYNRLQEIQVPVPDKDPPAAGAHDAAPANIDRPGVYVIQAGAFRNQKDADRVQAQLRVLGVDSVVQRVQDERGEMFRVRIGPLTDLVEINRLRARLRAAEFESQPVRVAD